MIETAYKLAAELFIAKYIEDCRGANQSETHVIMKIIKDVCGMFFVTSTYKTETAVAGVNKYLNEWGYKGLAINDHDGDITFWSGEYEDKGSMAN